MFAPSLVRVLECLLLLGSKPSNTELEIPAMHLQNGTPVHRIHRQRLQASIIVNDC